MRGACSLQTLASNAPTPGDAQPCHSRKECLAVFPRTRKSEYLNILLAY